MAAPKELIQDQVPVQSFGDLQNSPPISTYGAGDSPIGRSIRSPNYVQNISGWSIDSNGKAQFTDVDIGRRSITVDPGESIQGAIDSLSAGEVILRNGTHKVSNDIVLKSSVYLRGENAESAIIDFGSGAYQIKAVGSNAYSAGTVSITAGTTALSGSSTSWSTNVAAGMYALLDGLWYPIASVGNDTTITLAMNFAGTTLSGASYVIAVPIYDVKVQELVIKNSTTAAIKFQYMTEGWCFDLNTQTNTTGIDIDDSSQISMNQCDFIGNGTHASLTNSHFMSWDYCSGILATGNGFELNNVTNSVFNGAFALSNVGDGMNITSCSTLRIDGAFKGNGGQGIEFVSGNSKIYVKTSAIENNVSDGVKLTATTDNCFVESSFISGNGGYGVNIAAATCDNTVIANCNFSSNSSGAANDAGTGTVRRGNVGLNDSSSSAVTVIGTVASDSLVASADTERDTASDTYVKLKEIEVRMGGVIRVKFDLNSSTGSNAFGRIYVNGAAVGTERQQNTSYATFSEDITVQPYDLVQLYANHPAGGADLAKVKNFRIYYSVSALAETTVNTD